MPLQNAVQTLFFRFTFVAYKWLILFFKSNEWERRLKNWTIDSLKLLQNWLSDSLFFYSILKGYKLHGPSIKHCNGTGHWDDYGNPICMRKYLCEFVYCHHNFLTLSDHFSIRLYLKNLSSHLFFITALLLHYIFYSVTIFLI